MIEALDHISLLVDDVPAAVADYATMFGRNAGGQRLQLDNIALEIVADPRGAPAAPQIGLVFAVRDLNAAAHRLARRGLPSGRITPQRVQLDAAATHVVSIGLIERDTAPTPKCAPPAGDRDILGLDHVVVRTPDPERAVALYGGRLGLDLRLDRTNPERGNRLLFFVCGDLVVEVSHDTRKGVGGGRDAIWGMAWRSADVQRSRARMQAAGVAVSEIRTGNRPGTEVFTVKSHTAGVPTLIIGGHGLERR